MKFAFISNYVFNSNRVSNKRPCAFKLENAGPKKLIVFCNGLKLYVE